MKISVLTSTYKETKPFGNSGVLKPILFENETLAEKYIDNRYPSASEITQRLIEQYPWKENINRTFFVEIPRYDEDGQWDYSIEYTFEIEECEVQNN